jgi:tetratricopeptide (TPR) repeat protein
VEYAEAGAREHARARDFDQAAALYCTALAALDLCAAPDPARRCDILIALGDAQTRAGDLCAAQQTLANAAEVAQRLGDAGRLAEIVLAAPPLDGPLASSPNELVITLAENVLGSLPEGEVTQRALVMARLAAELSHLHDQRGRSGQLAARALEMVKDCAGHEPTVLTVLGLRDYLLRRPELAAERLTNSAEVIAMARQRGDWAAVFAGEWAREMALLQLGEIGGADTRLQALAQAATMAGPGHQALVAALTGARAYQEGRFAEGEEWFARCRALAPGDGGPDLPDQLWPLMIMPMDERGRLAQLEPVVARCFRTYPNSTFVRAMWCWLALRLGRRSEARFHLERLAAGGFADLKCSRAVLVGAAALTEVCAELDDAPHHAVVLYELLLPYAKSNAILDINAGLGATSRYLGKLALSLSRIDEAIEHLAAAVEFNNRIGARAWAAYAAHELAVALLFRGRPWDARRALELMANAYSEAVCMGMERLAGAIKAGAARIEFGREELPVETNFPFPIADRKLPNNGVTGVLTGPPPALRPASEGAGRAPQAVDSGTRIQGQAARSSAVLRLEAEYWTAQYQGRTVRLKHLKGLALIAYLLSRPHQEVHALELAGIGDPQANGIAHRAQYPVESLDLGPVLDPAAKQTYRQRIRELHEELDEARSFNDLERAAKIEQEIRLIACELSRALGLNGRDRKTSSQVERARLRVTNAIKSAINKISNHHHELGRFLARSIRTGTFCCYVPESDSCPDWTF